MCVNHTTLRKDMKFCKQTLNMSFENMEEPICIKDNNKELQYHSLP